MGSWCGHGNPTSGYVPGDGYPAPDLARIEGDRTMNKTMKRAANKTMKRVAALFLICAPLLAAGLPESIQKLLDSSPAARTAFWGIQIVALATGTTLYDLNPAHYFVPAPNAKL